MCLLLVLGGCVTKKPKPTAEPAPSSPEYTEDPSSQEPPLAEAEEAIEEPPPEKQPKIALVLGGSGVASFATIGILKKFQEEEIRIEYIVTTGWPTLFALGHGFFNSIHDLEWFGVRLKQENFYEEGLFGFKKGFQDHKQLQNMVKRAFDKKDLRQTKLPIHISVSNPKNQRGEIYSEGDWKVPLLKAMSSPGIYRPYQDRKKENGIFSLKGLDVETALAKGADIIIAIDMYGDYLNTLSRTPLDSREGLFTNLYVHQFKQRLQAQIDRSQFRARIKLRARPNDFTKKRAAILAGYQQAARILRSLKKD